MVVSNVGEGKVILIAGGGKVYTDIAARFCDSNKDLEDIIGSSYNKNIVRNIIESGHLAATEFDNFIFGIEGFSRVTEAQLIRKRLASYLIKSGRQDKGGKREFDIVLPEDIMQNHTTIEIPSGALTINGVPGKDYFANEEKEPIIQVLYDTTDILDILEQWYNSGVENGYKEEELRYMKPQGTEFKAIFSMNTHALLDWFKIRMCENAQTEIRDLAYKMFRLVRDAAPDLFRGAGASCVSLGYCPEGSRMNEKCKGKFYTKDEAIKILKETRKEKTSDKSEENVMAEDPSVNISSFLEKRILLKINPILKNPLTHDFLTIEYLFDKYTNYKEENLDSDHGFLFLEYKLNNLTISSPSFLSNEYYMVKVEDTVGRVLDIIKRDGEYYIDAQFLNCKYSNLVQMIYSYPEHFLIDIRVVGKPLRVIAFDVTIFNQDGKFTPLI